MKTTKRLFKTTSPTLISPSDFLQMHFIYAKQFESEATESGWIGVNLRLNEDLKENMVLVLWTCSEALLKIDRFNRVEKFSM